MNREQVIEWAKQAGFKVAPYTGGKKEGKESVFDFGDVDMLHELKRFAELVAAAEREACAAAIQRRIDLQRTGCKTEVEAIRCLAAIKNKETK